MIREVIVTTVDREGNPHLAPMGVHDAEGEMCAILPFRPSTTLDNLLATRGAVINHSDDVRVFAGCLTGRRDWPLVPAERIAGMRLAECLAHTEMELVSVEDDDIRPRLLCRPLHTAQHAPFRGFNRAQFAVLEAAILVSRLEILPWTKIESELDYLRVIVAKTAGEKEREAWEWLMEAVAVHKRKTITPEEREKQVREHMEVAGVDRVTAEFIVAEELGEIEGDLIAVKHGYRGT